MGFPREGAPAGGAPTVRVTRTAMTHWFLFSAGVQALKAQSQAIGAISDNISNSTTVGYKTSEVRFQELVTQPRQAIDRPPTYSGVQTHVFQFLEREGTVARSDDLVDGALVGRGFYVTRTGPNEGDFELTDAGDFGRTLIDNGGTEEVYLTDLKGNFVMGWPADVNGVVTPGTDLGGLRPIRVDTDSLPSSAQATDSVRLAVNLDNTTPTGGTYTVATTVFDGTGGADGVGDGRDITYTWTKTANPNEWTVTVGAPVNGSVTAPAAPIPVTFGADGRIVTPTNIPVSVTWTNPAAANTIDVSLAGSTQYNLPSTPLNVDVNGNDEGQFVELVLRENGNLVARYSNDIVRTIARVAAGNVPSPGSLSAVQGTHYAINDRSGPIELIDIASTSQLAIVPNAVEQSTTDIGNEFGKLIIAQSAYSSAATAVRTVDEMSQTATRLKN